MLNYFIILFFRNLRFFPVSIDIIITIISFLLKEFEKIRVVKYAFFGIRAGVLALIVKAFWTMYKKCPKSIFNYCVMAVALIAVAFLKILVGQDMTLNQMAETLNKEGFVTSHGYQFSPSTVYKLIKRYNLK